MVRKRGILSRIFKFSDQPESVRQKARTLIIHRDSVGTTGTYSSGGFPREEYLAALQGSARADIFDKMRRGDYQAMMLLGAVKYTLLAAIYEIEPGGDSDEEKKDAELIEHILLKDMMRPTWNKFLEEAYTICEFGHSVFEKIHKTVVNHPKFGSYIGLESLAFRSPKTIERWNLDPLNGALISILQQAQGDLHKNVTIPAEFLLVFNIGQEGSNYEGISLLRPCYGPYIRKELYLKLNAMGIEGHAKPLPIADVPENKQDTPEYDRLIQVLESYVGHEKGYIVKPKGWDITLEKNAYDPSKTEASIDAEDKRMAKAFLANFLELGMGSSSGSWALSTDLSDFFLNSIKYVANGISGPINTSLIPELVQLNRGPRETYPTLKISGIDDKAGKELAEIFKTLADSKGITPDDPTEDNLRKRYGLPKRDPNTARISQPAPVAVPGQTPGQPGGQDPGANDPKMKQNQGDNGDMGDDMEDDDTEDMPNSPETKKTKPEKDKGAGQNLAERIRLAEAKRKALLNAG